MLKKISRVMVLIMLLLISTFNVSVLAFTDIATNPSEEVITRWQKAGLVSGYPDKTFRPDEIITKAEFAKIISDLFVLESTENGFKDVSENEWYYTYVNKASEYIGYENSGNEKLFMPEKPMTMKEILAALSNLIKVEGAVAEGNATRERVICLIDSVLGGKTGFYYMLAVIDAHIVEEEEILPLVTLSKESPMATVNDKNQVLLLSWHLYPKRYTEGENFTCEYGEIWTFTDKEILSWYDNNKENISDWELRLEQLIGLPPDNKKTHVSAFWVDIDDVIRPAYEICVTKQLTIDHILNPKLEEHEEWFYENEEYSYEISAYPWTRLGYTYDWLDNGKEYGLSEFLILPDSVIGVEWTKSLDEFILWLEEN